VDYGYTGTATPSKQYYTFTPPSIPYNNVTSPMTNQNYTATCPPAPQITGIDPNQVTRGKTYTFSLTGKDFKQQFTATLIDDASQTFNIDQKQFISSTSIKVTVFIRSGPTGTQTIRITNPDGLSGSITFQALSNTLTLLINGGSSSTKQQGESFSLTGSGFTPNQSVTRYVKDPGGTQTTITPSIMADSAGNIAWTYATTCSSTPGANSIWTVDDASGRASTTVTATVATGPSCGQPVFEVAPKSGPLGTAFSYRGSGFSPDKATSLKITRGDGSILDGVIYLSDSSGSFSFKYTSQPTDPTGTWSVQVTDITTGKKSNIVQVEYTKSDTGTGTDVVYFDASSVDKTIQENAQFSPGVTFGVVWRIKNAGTNNWNGYNLVWVSGTINGNTSVNLASQSQLPIPPTGPGQWIEETPVLSMTAPSMTGTYYSYWQMQNSSGVNFGDRLRVKIRVVAPQPVSAAQGSSSQGTGDAPTSKSGFHGDPVNTALGNYTYERTDLKVPGRGIDFVFSRTYNSSDSTLGPLGYGWSHSYNTYLFNISSGLVSVHYSDGKVLEYENMGGTYQSCFPGYYDLLTQNADGSWTLLKMDQRKYLFDASGKLTSIQDKNDNQIALSYDPSGRLSQVTDSVGRQFQFSYSGSQLVSLADSAGRTLQFTYDTASNLIRFTDALNNPYLYYYDSEHRLTRVVDPRGNDLLLNEYDAAGRVVRQTNGRGNSWQFTYDDAGKRTTITDPSGRTEVHLHDTNFLLQRTTDRLSNAANILYDDNNNRSQVSDPRGNYQSFQYDARGNITGSTDPLLNSRQISYDGRNNPTEVIDEIGGKTQMSYDTPGNPTTLTDALNNAANITYNSYGQPLIITDPNGKTTTLSYDSQGNLASIKDALNNTTSFLYDAVGRPTKVTNARGKSTSYTYDANDNLLTVTDPLGGVTTNTYDANNNLVSAKDPRGNITSFQYDQNNLLVKVTDALGNSIEHTYDNLDRRTATLDKRGNTTQYGYDNEGRLTSVTDPAGNVIKYGYDANGNHTSVTDAKNQTTNFSYDALNRITKIADPLGNTIQREYDPAGRLAKETDPRRYATAYAYDAVGNLTQVTDPKGGTAKYAYDKNRNRISETDPNDNSSTFTYDSLNRLLSSKDPLNNTYSYTYDAAGNRITQTDAKNQTTSFAYDDSNRPIRITYPDSSTVQFAYDSVGNVIQLVDALGTTSYVYDALNRLISYQDPFGKTIGYQYDENGNLTRLTYPDGKQVSYQYDVSDRMTSLTDWAGRTTTYQYDSTNLVTRITYPNGTTATYGYDSLGRSIRLFNSKSSGAVINSYDLTLDPYGNRVAGTIQEPLLNQMFSSTQTYAYDAANRIRTAGSATFAFDPNGNMTSQTQNGVITTYGYDFNNRLIKVGTVSQYSYNGRGVRLQKTEGSVTIRYVVDINHDLSQVLCETDGSGAITAYYVYGLGLVYKVNPSGTHFYYHFDPIGSTIAMTDDSQSIVNSYAYDPFGRVSNSNESASQPFKYVGQYGVMQETNGLLCMRARYYEPRLGRFLTRDPLLTSRTDAQGLNRYVYVKNNSLRQIDPKGEIPHIIIGAIIGGLIDVGATFVSDVVNSLASGALTTGEWRFSSWQEYAGSFASGAVTGACAATTLGTTFGACTALGAAAGNALTQGLEMSPLTEANKRRKEFSLQEFGGDVAIGLATDVIGKTVESSVLRTPVGRPAIDPVTKIWGMNKGYYRRVMAIDFAAGVLTGSFQAYAELQSVKK
jgi:RHS repeat-associated protein